MQIDVARAGLHHQFNGQKGVCWAVVTSNGRYAYTINAGSGTISSYAVSPEGF